MQRCRECLAVKYVQVALLKSHVRIQFKIGIFLLFLLILKKCMLMIKLSTIYRNYFEHQLCGRNLT